MLSLVAVLASVMGQTVDYAQAVHVDDWLRHPVLGDPSFDSFVHAPNNPITKGTPPYEWPVNGFLFEDPQSGNWYVYVGLYPKNYAMIPGAEMTCDVYRSANRGGNWERVGRAWPQEPFYFRGDTSPASHAPDVSVVYEDGVYHMIYDWCTANTTWETASNPAGGADNGIAYARAERPEGPFITTPEPVYRTSQHPPFRGKYRRGYAATLVRRANDWLVLAMNDSGPNFSWAMFAMTAPKPEGPYSEPVYVRIVEEPYYHPPLMEFFPAFSHEGRVYAPATSVAMNRNFQVLFSAPLERATDPAAWEITRLGSIWHAEDRSNEHYGIWGQTFSGFIDREQQFHVMFPSRDPEGMGTINIASRPWNQPFRDRFVLTGHEGPSITLLRHTADAFEVEAELNVRGKATLFWDYQGPLGPDKPASGAKLHPLTLTRYNGIEIEGAVWRSVRVGQDGKREELASGPLPEGPSQLRIMKTADGKTPLLLNGNGIWLGDSTGQSGAIGLLVEPATHLEVSHFTVTGETRPAKCAILWTEAILGAGAAKDSWQEIDASTFRYGRGAVSLQTGAMAKWNFEGSGCALWLPRGPQYGKADLWLDGEMVETLDLHTETGEPSAPRFTREGLTGFLHTLILRPHEGIIPLDSLEVTM
ncbi:MAG: hypothetical protein RBU21_01895 [FCB group bacterium]|jgi:hypothetical protein|nr:hypothetical protein [FCB group bacterium]